MNNVLSAIGLITGLSGSLFIALNIGLFTLGYTLFIISSVSWMIYAYKTKQSSLLVLNMWFLIVNIIGFYNFL